VKHVQKLFLWGFGFAALRLAMLGCGPIEALIRGLLFGIVVTACDMALDRWAPKKPNFANGYF